MRSCPAIQWPQHGLILRGFQYLLVGIFDAHVVSVLTSWAVVHVPLLMRDTVDKKRKRGAYLCAVERPE